MRYLAIDHGEKRTGLAVGSDTTGIVTPLDVLEAPNMSELLRLIAHRADEGRGDRRRSRCRYGSNRRKWFSWSARSRGLRVRYEQRLGQQRGRRSGAEDHQAGHGDAQRARSRRRKCGGPDGCNDGGRQCAKASPLSVTGAVHPSRHRTNRRPP